MIGSVFLAELRTSEQKTPPFAANPSIASKDNREPKLDYSFEIMFTTIMLQESEQKRSRIFIALKEKRQEILRLAQAHGASNVRVFGSVARGEEGPESDLDLLVEMKPECSLLDLISLWQDLEDLLGHKVDVITEGGISPYLRDHIHAEAVPL
jgi:predicted nucleotidyltransferase